MFRYLCVLKKNEVYLSQKSKKDPHECPCPFHDFLGGKWGAPSHTVRFYFPIPITARLYIKLPEKILFYKNCAEVRTVKQ